MFDLPRDTLVGAVRIAFGVMFIIKMAFTVAALDLNWAHRRPFGRYSPILFPASLATLFLSAALLTVGLVTWPAAVVTWLLYMYLGLFLSIFGLEDFTFASLGLYLVLTSPGASLSLDSALSLPIMAGPLASSLIPELALSSILGMVWLSAGISKLQSPMWRQGLGAYYFFLLPNHRRWSATLFLRSERLMRALGFATLASQLLLLPAFLVNAMPFGLILWAYIAGFAVTLSTLFVFTWLGEGLLLGFAVVLWLLLDTGSAGLASRWVAEWRDLAGPVEVATASVLLATLLGALWTAVVPHLWPGLARRRPRLHGLARRLARLPWGFVPVVLFTEKHLKGPLVYRPFVEGPWGEHEALCLYRPDGRLGRGRRLRPTFIDVTAYKVSEACMDLDEDGRLHPERFRFVDALAVHVARTVQDAVPGPITSVRFRILQLIPPAGYTGDNAPFRRMPWIDAFRVYLDTGTGTRVEPLRIPILTGPTGRDRNRLSFGFETKSG